MFVGLSGLRVSRRVLTLVVRISPDGAGVVVVATKRGHRIRLRLTRRRGAGLTFSAKLFAGHWTVTVTTAPPAGYAAAAPVRRTLVVH